MPNNQEASIRRQVSTTTLVAARGMLLRGGETSGLSEKIAKRLKISRHTVERSVFADGLPVAKCATCGRRVVLPCVACYAESVQKGER
jgi:hypothetical protein